MLGSGQGPSLGPGLLTPGWDNVPMFSLIKYLNTFQLLYRSHWILVEFLNKNIFKEKILINSWVHTFQCVFYFRLKWLVSRDESQPLIWENFQLHAVQGASCKFHWKVILMLQIKLKSICKEEPAQPEMNSMAATFEQDLKKKLGRSKAEKVFRPWWDEVEDTLLNTLVILGMKILVFWSCFFRNILWRWNRHTLFLSCLHSCLKTLVFSLNLVKRWKKSQTYILFFN